TVATAPSSVKLTERFDQAAAATALSPLAVAELAVDAAAVGGLDAADGALDQPAIALDERGEDLAPDHGAVNAPTTGSRQAASSGWDNAGDGGDARVQGTALLARRRRTARLGPPVQLRVAEP